MRIGSSVYGIVSALAVLQVSQAISAGLSRIAAMAFGWVALTSDTSSYLGEPMINRQIRMRHVRR